MKKSYFAIDQERVSAAKSKIDAYFSKRIKDLTKLIDARDSCVLSTAETALYIEMLGFDFTYNYTDDGDVWRRCRAHHTYLLETITELKDSQYFGSEHAEFLSESLSDADKRGEFIDRYGFLSHKDLDAELEFIKSACRSVKDAFYRCFVVKYDKTERVCGELGAYFDRYAPGHPVHSTDLIDRHHRKTPGYSALALPYPLESVLKFFNGDRKWVQDWLQVTYAHPNNAKSKYADRLKADLGRELRQLLPLLYLTPSYDGSIMIEAMHGCLRKHIAVSTKYYGKPLAEFKKEGYFF